MSARIAIIGFGSAGFSALMAIRRYDPRAEAIIIDPKPSDLVHPCGMPYALEGIVPVEKLSQNVALASMNAMKITARAETIDISKKIIMLRDETNAMREVAYDTAIIATGYRPIVPPIKHIQNYLQRGVYTLANLADVHEIRGALPSAESAVVVGGGAIGLEAAEALKKHIRQVTIVEMKPQLLPGVLDADMAEQVAKHLLAKGIECRTGCAVEEMVGDGTFRGVMAGGQLIAANLCILAAGFAPNTDIARESGIALEPFGISVDRMLRTSAPDVYAAGDCIASWSLIDGKKIPVKLATAAYKQGAIAGANACGQKREYHGTAGTFVTKLGDLEIAGTGFTAEHAERAGFVPSSGKISSKVLPDYFPGEQSVTVKIVADKHSGALLGAQALGDGAAARVNLIGMALEYGIALEQLPSLEMAYCPAVSEVYDPLQRAVDFTMRRIKR
jgi:NADH oxidase (H2O2-forming)